MKIEQGSTSISGNAEYSPLSKNTKGYPALTADVWGYIPKNEHVPFDWIADAISRRLKVQRLFKNPEKAIMIAEAMDVALNRAIPTRDAGILREYYGLDDPEGKGKTQKEIGQQLDYPITNTRVGQIVEKTRRRLRHPSRAKFYVHLLLED